MTPTIQNDWKPVVGDRAFYSERGVNTSQPSSVKHVDNNTKKKSQLNSHLYCSRSFAARRKREHLSLLVIMELDVRRCTPDDGGNIHGIEIDFVDRTHPSRRVIAAIHNFWI